ncbi:hypothetical protein ACTFIZ_012546 [Dictyostelium cf. discoideum]
MSNILFIIYLVLLSIIFVNSQGSPSSCTFNGINYGKFSNGSYSALSAESGSNPQGKYRYYWNICGVANQCRGNGVSACQIEVGSPSSPTSVGLTSQGSFSTSYLYGTQLKYTTFSKCSNGNYRTFVMTFICSDNQVISSSLVSPNDCIYTVEMSGNAFCPTPTPTPTPTPSVTCESSNGILINSSDIITCIGYGQSMCTTSSGYSCETDQINGILKCVSPDNSISCVGNQFYCYTQSYTCSVDSNSYNGLEVNGKIINSTYFSS